MISCIVGNFINIVYIFFNIDTHVLLQYIGKEKTYCKGCPLTDAFLFYKIKE